MEDFNKPPILSSNELYRFCEEFSLTIELEKPFEELDGFLIKIIEDGEVVKQEIVNEMTEYESVCGTILNKMSQNYPKNN